MAAVYYEKKWSTSRVTNALFQPYNGEFRANNAQEFEAKSGVVVLQQARHGKMIEAAKNGYISCLSADITWMLEVTG